MPTADPITFTRLADGTTLQRQDDGSYLPVKPLTDRARLASVSDDEIERMSADDLDHPGLDDSFWASAQPAELAPRKEAISIKLDNDVLSFFRQEGRGYQTRINAVLRRYVAAHQKERR